jgi:hypothetical protein
MKPKQASRRLFRREEGLPLLVSLAEFENGKSDGGMKLPCFSPCFSDSNTKISDMEVRFSARDDEFALRRAFEVNTKYKKKSERHLPVKKLDESGDSPGGDFNWKQQVLKKVDLERAKREHTRKYKDFIIPRITGIARGARLSEERVQTISVGEDLSPEERHLFLEILYAREEALA